MDYLRKELNKLLPLALLCGAVGGVMLIILGNVLFSGIWAYALTYILVIGISVYALNRLRYKKEVMSSVLYGYCVFIVMTAIAYMDVLMNADPNFTSPIFERVSFFALLVILVFMIAAFITTLFKRRVLA